MEPKCCNQAVGCFNDSGCSALLSCVSTNCTTATTIAAISSCADASCSQYASSKTLMMTYLNCIDTNCASACGL